MLSRQEILPGGDSATYVQVSLDLFGNGDSGNKSSIRPPGYPLFLALARAMPGRFEDGAIALQLLIGAAFAGASVLFLWRHFGAIAAVITGALVALGFPNLYLESILLADALFGFAVCGACAALITAMSAGHRRWRWLVLFGVVAALATYIKPVGHILVLAPIAPLLVATRSVRETFVGSLVVALVVMGLTVPWMIRNSLQHGAFSMSAQSGITLFNRAFERDHLPVPIDKPGGRQLQRFLDEHPDLRPSSGFYSALVNGGMTPTEANATQRDLALTAIRRHPLVFAGGVLASIRTTYNDVARGDQVGTLDALVAPRLGPLPRQMTDHGLGLGDDVRRLWSVGALGGVAVLLWYVIGDRLVRVSTTCVVSVWLAVALAMAVMHGGLYRYSASLAPFVWLMGSAGLVTLLGIAGQYLTPQRRAALLAMARAGAAAGRRRPPAETPQGRAVEGRRAPDAGGDEPA